MDAYILANYISLFFLQYIPNAFIYILAGYSFENRDIDMRYLVSSIALSLIGFLIKMLSMFQYFSSIDSMVQVLIILINIVLLIGINKITLINAIFSSIAIMMLQLMIEIIYLGILKIEPQVILSQPYIVQTIIGLPTLIIIGIVSVLFYYLRKKKRDEIRR